MFCPNCGRPLTNGALYCVGCGSPAFPKPDEEDLSLLVLQARSGNQMAVSRLYEKTYSKVFYTVKSMIKDEDTVLDIVQDTYLKAFSHLDHFTGNDKFLPWVKQIAANTARDWLKKKRPTLFSELAPSEEDEDRPIEEQFVDERTTSIPERLIDESETKRLLREIIDSLPEDQRAAIGMFYYEEMSVKEIAQAMGTSESAVKSRLMYARKKIEKNVRDLEKQGTKLYSLAPIPFLLMLFRCQKTYASELPDQSIRNALLQSTAPAAAANAAPAGAASKTAAANKAAGKALASHVARAGAAHGAKAGIDAVGIAIRIAIGAIAATALICGGIAASVELSSIFGSKSPSAVVEEVEDSHASREEQDSFIDNTSDISEVLEETKTSVEEAPPVEEIVEDTSLEDALAMYREIIQNAPSYDHNTDQTTLYRQYALEYIDSTLTVPALFLEQAAENGYQYARIFQYDPENGTLIQPEKILFEGVALRGGFRGSISIMADGHGIKTTDLSAGTGDEYIYRVVLNGDVLESTKEWYGMLNDSVPDSLDSLPITWCDVTDLSLIDNYVDPRSGNAVPITEETKTEESKPTEVEGSATEQALIEEPGRITVTGVIDLFSYDEVIELQGCPDPNGQWSAQYEANTVYLLLVLDEPTRMTSVAFHGETHTSTVSLILLNTFRDGVSETRFTPYYGKHLTFTVDQEQLSWPSDTRMPVGQPSGGDLHVFE